MKVSEISAKAKDFLMWVWKRMEVTSLRKGSKSPFFASGTYLQTFKNNLKVSQETVARDQEIIT